MDYGRLIGDAWRMTWRHRFLWLLGLFGGGASGFSVGNSGGDFSSLFDQGGAGTRGGRGATASPDAFFADAARWLGDHLGLVIALALLLVLISLVLFVVSFIAQGGLSGATVELGTGRPSGFRHALRIGLRLFWRNVGLWLILALAGLIVLMVVAIFVGVAVLAAMATEQNVGIIVVSVLLGLLLLLVLLVCGAVAGVVVSFARRAIPLLDIGPFDALGDGWRVARLRPGTTFLIWLLDVVLNVGTSIVTAIVMVVLLLVLGLPVLIAWLTVGDGGRSLLYPAIIYGVIAGALWFGALLFVSSLVNTFHWSYWTLAYLRLRAPEVQPPAPGPA